MIGVSSQFNLSSQKAEAGASERKGLGDQRQDGSPIKITHFAPLENRSNARRVLKS